MDNLQFWYRNLIQRSGNEKLEKGEKLSPEELKELKHWNLEIKDGKVLEIEDKFIIDLTKEKK